MHMLKPAQKSAAGLIAELDSAPLGQPIDVLLAEAIAAIAADRAAAFAVLFPADIVRAGADILSLYSFHTSRYDRPGFDGRMAVLHRRALGTVPELCPLLRSPEAIADIEAAASAIAAPTRPHETYAEAGARAAAEARARYETAISEQLVAAGGDLAVDARRLLESDRLSARVALVKAKHEEHARATAAQIELEARARAAAQLVAAEQAEHAS